ncbi:hypothetical protein QBC38DRAFT_527166 [Podospora fimiseda]|uniref:Uncharacterized protein n=1 Tax=Podospora fimiseda TaxID=252190 RepID=A0AAN6YQE5_9PEZI|nr:hypothetical protein QBC38DRAFT_527166 [Podospora fimiseda]
MDFPNMASSLSNSEESISTLSAFAFSSLSLLNETSAKIPPNGALAPEAQDFLGPFQLWAENTSAKSLSAQILDDKRPESRNSDGSIDEPSSDERVDDTEGTDSEYQQIAEHGGERVEEPTNKVELLFLRIRSSIYTVFRLSILIRRHRPRGREAVGTENQGPPEDPLDTRPVCDLFPHVKSKPWLASHEATALADNTGTIATTFVGHDTGGQHSPQPKALSVLTSKTSLFSIKDDQEGLTVPDLSDMILYGRKLEYGEPFEYPYCRTIQNIPDRFE